MKKTSIVLISVLLIVQMLSGFSANAKGVDYNLWDKFIKYDLCISDYSSLTEKEKELCKFIFETEQSADETIICERARRILAHDNNIGERITLNQLSDAYGIWDNYSADKSGWQTYIHCVPDIRHLDAVAYDEYWLDDEGSSYVIFNEKYNPDDISNFEVYDNSYNVIETISAKQIFSPYSDFRNDAKYREEFGFIEKNGGYYYIKSDNTAVFAWSDYTYSNGDEPITEPFVIESEIDGCPVIAIEKGALGYSPFIEIVLPDSIKFIDEFAFAGCSNLEKINFPKNLEYMGRFAFSECCSLKQVDINCSELKISEKTFYNCNELTSVELNVKSIAESAFDSCNKINNVCLGKNIVKICQSTFLNTELKSIIIPPTVEIIGALPAAKGGDSYSGIGIEAVQPLNISPVCAFNSDCTIYGYRGTEAERYAKKWNLTFIELEAEKGDINLDGEINIADAVTLQSFILGKYVKTGAFYGDLNNDNSVDVFDMIEMRKIISKTGENT